MTELVLLTERDRVATLTLNRPEKRNAMHGPMVEALSEKLLMLASNENIRVVVLKGNGADFCAGGDIAWMQAMGKGAYAENVADAEKLSNLMYMLYNFPKPTVVLGHGAILGGGLGLLAACDIVLVARGSSFGFAEVKVGLVPSTISPYIVAAIGARLARYYFITGERFDAQEAKRIGLVHQVVEPDLLQEAGERLFKELLQNGPDAVNAAKQLIHHVTQEGISPKLGEKLAVHLANLRISKEVQEGLTAFMEKRQPTWR